MNKEKKIKYYSGFTLIEMLVVLLIISILLLLFVPNLSKHKDNIDQKATDAVIKLVETQIDLYKLEKNQTPSIEQLLKEKYITLEQYKKYQSIHE